MTDIQATVSANLGQTLQQLDQLKAKIDQITKATAQATKAAKDHQASLGNTAKALGKAGGQAGGLFGKVGEAAGMGGPMGALAAGAAILGSTFKILNDVARVQIDTVRASTAAMGQMTSTARSALQAGQQSALSAIRSQAGARRRLQFRAGQGAQGMAERIAARGATSNVDAMEAVTETWDMQGTSQAERDSILAAAEHVAGTGELSMTEAVKAIAANPGARAAARSGNVRRAAAIAIGGNNPERVKRAEGRLAAYAAEGGSNVTGLQVDENLAEQSRTNDLAGARAASGANLAAARDPVGAAMLAVGQQQLSQLEAMRKNLDSMPVLAKVLDKLTGNRAALEYQAAVDGYADAQMNYQGGR